MAPSGFSPSMPATGGCARSLCPLHCNQKLRKGSAGLPRFRNGSNRSPASIKICWKNAKSAEALFFELFIFHLLSERSPPPLLMPHLLVRSFAPLLLAFQSCFTQPSFASFWALTCAWILC